MSADCSIEKGNFTILLHFYVEKGMCFCKTKQMKKAKQIIVTTRSGFNWLDADQGDQLIEQLRRCGASILLLGSREGLCFCLFELSSASCYE